jgi:hypothetical protein
LKANVHRWLGLGGFEQDGFVVGLGAMKIGAGAETRVVLNHRRTAGEFADKSAAGSDGYGLAGMLQPALKHLLEEAELAVDLRSAALDPHRFRMAGNSGVFFQNHGVDAGFSKQERRHQTAWTASDNEGLEFILIHNKMMGSFLRCPMQIFKKISCARRIAC